MGFDGLWEMDSNVQHVTQMSNLFYDEKPLSEGTIYAYSAQSEESPAEISPTHQLHACLRSLLPSSA